MSELNDETKTIPEEWLNEPDIAEAVKLSEQWTYTHSELLAYDKHWDVVSTEKTLISGAYEEGMQAGKRGGKTGRKNAHRPKTIIIRNEKSRSCVNHRPIATGFGSFA